MEPQQAEEVSPTPIVPKARDWRAATTTERDERPAAVRHHYRQPNDQTLAGDRLGLLSDAGSKAHAGRRKMGLLLRRRRRVQVVLFRPHVAAVSNAEEEDDDGAAAALEAAESEIRRAAALGREPGSRGGLTRTCSRTDIPRLPRGSGRVWRGSPRVRRSPIYRGVPRAGALERKFTSDEHPAYQHRTLASSQREKRAGFKASASTCRRQDAKNDERGPRGPEPCELTSLATYPRGS